MKITQTVFFSILASLTALFTSAATAEPASPGTYRPGLWQGKVNSVGAWDATLDESVIPVERVPGTIMADVYAEEGNYFKPANSYTNPETGSVYQWSKQNSCFIYEGEMFVTQGTAYGFGKRCDDGARIWVENLSNPVLNNNTWNQFGNGLYTATATGWIPVRAVVSDGTGNKGPQNNGINGSGLGLAYNTIGNRNENSPEWLPLADSGDMTLFRVWTDENMDFLRGVSFADGIYTLAIGLPDGSGTAKVFLGDPNTDPDTWVSSDVVTMPLGGSVAVQLPYSGSATPSIIVHATGSDSHGGFVAVTQPRSLDGYSVAHVRLVYDPSALDETTLSGDLVLANGNPSVTLSFTYAIADDPGSAITTTKTIAAGSHFILPFSTITWDTSYTYTLTLVEEPSIQFSGEFSTPVERFPSNPGLWQGRYSLNGGTDPHLETRLSDVDPDLIDRTLGMLMARGSSDDKPSGCTDALTTKDWGWSENYLCFIYEGYIWLEKGVTLYVASRFDDGTALYINDTEICNQWAYNGTQGGWNAQKDYTAGSYTPAYTGWHTFRSYIWDWAGSKNRQYGLAAMQWSTNPIAVTIAENGRVTAVQETIKDATLWNEFYDDGTGSFLADAQFPIQVVTAAMEGDTLSAVVTVPAIGPCTLVAWYGTTYGASDPAAWDSVSPTLATLSGESEETLSISFDIGSNARQIRFVAIPTNGTSAPSASATLFRSQLTTVDTTPLLSATLLTPATSFSATPVVHVQSTGLGSDSCDIYLLYGYAPEALTHTNLVATEQVANDSVIVPLDGLLPDRQYYLAFRAISNLGAESTTPFLTFNTAPLPESESTANASLPGLWQAVISGYNKLDPVRTAGNIEVVPGAMMTCVANVNAPYTSYTTPSGRIINPSNNTTYAYDGYMFMEAGLTYTFAADYDDMTYLAINGEVLFHDTIYNTAAYASFSPEASGWYSIDVRVSDNGGNNGPTGGAFLPAYLGSAFGYSTTETTLTTANFTQWHALTNTPEAVIFRTEPLIQYPTFDAFSVDTNGNLTATLSFGTTIAPRDLFVCYGPTYGGTNLTDWAHVEKLTTLDPTDTSFTSTADVTGVYDTTHYVRFYIDAGFNGLLWTPSLIFGDGPTPILSASATDADPHGGDAITLRGKLEATGGSECSVTLEISRDPSLADAIVHPILTSDEPTDLVLDLFTDDTSSPAYIQPGVTYYYRFKAVNLTGDLATSPTCTITPEAGVKLGPTSISNNLFDLTLNGSFTDFGANDTTLYLLVGTSADDLSVAASQTLTTGDNGYTFTFEVPVLDIPYYYYVLASNSCATVSWYDDTLVASFTPKNIADFYWRADVHSGSWTDPNNWETSPADPRLTYPNAVGSRVLFTRCTADAPYAITVPGAYNVKTLNLKANDATFSFLGSDPETSRIYAEQSFDTYNEGFGIGQGTTVTLDAIHFSTPDCYRAYARSTLILLNGSTFQTKREIWMNYDDATIEAHGDSLIRIIDYSFELNALRTRLILDDSTLRIETKFLDLAADGNSYDNVVEFYGTHPQIYSRGIYVAGNSGANDTNTGVPTLRFHVPSEGYAEAPIQRITDQHVIIGNDKQDLHIEIAADSPWFQGSRTANIPLIAWKYGILASRITTDNQPRPDLTTYYYTYGQDTLTDPTATTPDDANPTGLWVNLSCYGPTVILLR